MRQRREWRVHQHDGGHGRGGQVIVDLRRVEPSDGNRGKQRSQQVGAGRGEFVEDQRAAGGRGQDGEQPGSGRWFQHAVGRRDRRRRQRSEAQWQRRRELLERLAFLGSARVRRQQSDDARQHGKPCSRRVGLAEQRLSVFAQKQDRRDFARLIGGLPIPGACGVGGIERAFHRAAQERSVDPLAAFEMR